MERSEFQTETEMELLEKLKISPSQSKLLQQIATLEELKTIPDEVMREEGINENTIYKINFWRHPFRSVQDLVIHLRLEKYLPVLQNYSIKQLKTIGESELRSLGLKKGPIIRLLSWQKNITTYNSSRKTRKNVNVLTLRRERIGKIKSEMNNQIKKQMNAQKTVKQKTLTELLLGRKLSRLRSKTKTKSMPSSRLHSTLRYNSQSNSNYESSIENENEFVPRVSAKTYHPPIPTTAPELRRQESTSVQLYSQLSSNPEDRRLLDHHVNNRLGNVTILGQRLILKSYHGFLSNITHSGLYYNWENENKKVCHITLHSEKKNRSENEINVGSFHIKLDVERKHRKFLLNYIPDKPLGHYVISICKEKNELIDEITNIFIECLIEYYRSKGYLLEKVPPPELC
jgi:hypothetical protein